MMSKWQPIETAPRDGTEILAYDGTGVFICYFDEHADCWIIDFSCHMVCATHWMPLPEPPETSEGATNG